MIDIRLLREDPDRVRASQRARGEDEGVVDQILAAQYPSGGWPQSAPPGAGYARYITFNDNTTVNLLELLRDASRSPDFAWLDAPRREAARRACGPPVSCWAASSVRWSAADSW